MTRSVQNDVSSAARASSDEGSMPQQDLLPAGYMLVGEYQIQKLLGSGGFANTYLARDVTLDRSVAIKEYFPRDFAVRAEGASVRARSSQQHKEYLWGLDRFAREAKIISRLKHANIVRVFRVFNALNTAYIVLEFVDGADLDVTLSRRATVPKQSEIDAFLAPLLDALSAVHAEKILHRDIKPANIFIRRSDGAPVLIDFGASKFAFNDANGTTAAIVSRGYSPQEAYAADAKLQGPWTDIYSLSATLYSMIARRTPPESTGRVLADTLVPATALGLSGFRESFLAAIDWGLRVQPGQRPRSVHQWQMALLQGHAPVILASSPRRSWFGGFFGRSRQVAPPLPTSVARQPASGATAPSVAAAENHSSQASARSIPVAAQRPPSRLVSGHSPVPRPIAAPTSPPSIKPPPAQSHAAANAPSPTAVHRSGRVTAPPPPSPSVASAMASGSAAVSSRSTGRPSAVPSASRAPLPSSQVGSPGDVASQRVMTHQVTRKSRVFQIGLALTALAVAGAMWLMLQETEPDGQATASRPARGERYSPPYSRIDRDSDSRSGSPSYWGSREAPSPRRSDTSSSGGDDPAPRSQRQTREREGGPSSWSNRPTASSRSSPPDSPPAARGAGPVSVPQ